MSNIVKHARQMPSAYFMHMCHDNNLVAIYSTLLPNGYIYQISQSHLSCFRIILNTSLQKMCRAECDLSQLRNSRTSCDSFATVCKSPLNSYSVSQLCPSMFECRNDLTVDI